MKMLIAPLALLALAPAVIAEDLASSNFSTNPAPGNPRFTYNADSTLTAHYNTSLATEKLLFPLSHALTANDSFVVQARFKILSANYFADPNAAAQISFGLLNGLTTGSDRSGGVGHTAVDFGSSGNTYDSVAFDYFPNISAFYASPSLAPAIITSKTSTEPAFADLNSVFGQASALNDPGEAPLPFDTWLNSTLTYSAASRLLTLRLATDSAPLFINAGGGADSDTATIELALAAGTDFNVDRFGLTLWTDSYADFGPSVIADVTFSAFSVATTPVPEPASLLVLALGSCALLRRARH